MLCIYNIRLDYCIVSIAICKHQTLDQCFFSIIKMLLFYCILKNNFKLLYTFYLKFKVLVILSCFLMSAVCIGFNIFISVLVILVHQVKLNENQLAYIFLYILF